MMLTRGMIVNVKGFGSGRVIRATDKGAMIALSYMKDLQLFFTYEQIEIETQLKDKGESVTPRILNKAKDQKEIGSERIALESLRFGLVPTCAIEELTIGFSALQKWISGCFPDANRGKPTVNEIYGPFGTGKSHTMNLIRHLARKNGYLTVNAEVDGQVVSLSNPAKLINTLWSTLSAQNFISDTPLLDLYLKVLERKIEVLDLKFYPKIQANLQVLQFLKSKGQIERFASLIEMVLSSNEEQTATAIHWEMASEYPGYQYQNLRLRSMFGRTVDERPQNFIESLFGHALLSKYAGYKGLVITIDEFEIEKNLEKKMRERVSGLISALSEFFSGSNNYLNAPVSLFIASVGEDGHLGDIMLQHLISKASGKAYSLSLMSQEEYFSLAQKIFNLYCKAYNLNDSYNRKYAENAQNILQRKMLIDDSGLVRAFIKSYMSILDAKYGPPEESNVAR